MWEGFGIHIHNKTNQFSCQSQCHTQDTIINILTIPMPQWMNEWSKEPRMNVNNTILMLCLCYTLANYYDIRYLDRQRRWRLWRSKYRSNSSRIIGLSRRARHHKLFMTSILHTRYLSGKYIQYCLTIFNECVLFANRDMNHRNSKNPLYISSLTRLCKFLRYHDFHDSKINRHTRSENINK